MGWEDPGDGNPGVDLYSEDVVASTPLADDCPLHVSLSPILDRQDLRLDDSDVGQPRGAPRVVYSSEEDLTPPPEPTTTCLGAWKTSPVDVNKYVDDNLQVDQLNFENVVCVNGIKDKHAIMTQNVFRHVVRSAEMKGMKVNANKTNMICVSDGLHSVNGAHFYDRDGVKVESSDKLKVLGWHFSNRPSVATHLETIKRRFRERYWILRHLRHNGFSADDLLKVYKTIIRPVAEYMLEVFHPMMTDGQDEGLERLQSHALKCIYGGGLSGRRMRDMAGLLTLRERRIEQCDKFAAKCAGSERFEHWFPLKEGRRSARNGGKEKYKEEFARCKRLYNSPLFYMRRRLNGKEGREYGMRNKEFREG